jgi:hypothetical protein
MFTCPQCLFTGNLDDILEFTESLRKIDGMIDTLEARRTFLLEARRDAVLNGSIVYLRKVLTDIKLNPSIVTANCYQMFHQKSPPARRRGMVVATVELSAFMGWFVGNYYALMDGKLPLAQAAIPFIFLFQSLILFSVLKS